MKLVSMSSFFSRSALDYLGLASSQYCLKILEEVDVNIRRALGGKFPEDLTDSDVVFYEEGL